MIQTNVVISCGAAKRDVACAAGEMYTGLYHRACLKYALAFVRRENVFILSARYGLLRLDEVIEPYEQRIKGDGPFWRCVWEQADQFRMRGHGLILVCGADYSTHLRQRWEQNNWPVSAPLSGVGGMGKQLAWLKANTPSA